MTGEVESHRSRIIPIEHPERLMARLRGWDPVVDPFGTGLLRSFQCDLSSPFEPFTQPFTDTGYIRPQMLDNALFGYYPGNTVSQSEQETASAEPENVPRQPQLCDLSLGLVSASGVTQLTGYIQSVLTGSKEKLTAGQDDNLTMDTVDLNSTQGTTQEIRQGSTDKMTGRRGTTYVDGIGEVTISVTSDLNSTQGTTQEISQGSTENITGRRDTTYVDAKETISKTSDLKSTQGTTQEISQPQGSTEKITDRRGTTYVDAKETISKTSDLNSTKGTTLKISQGSTDEITGRRGTTYVDAKETIPETSDTGSKIDKNNDFSAQGQSRQDNDVINIGKDAIESGKRRGRIARDPDQTKTTGYMFDPSGIIPTHTGLHSLQHNTYEILNTDMEFLVNMDVTHFKPEEIEIRVEGNKITVRGRHAEREDDHGLIEREFTRIYMMPPDADPDMVASSLYANGVLTVKAPKRQVAV